MVNTGNARGQYPQPNTWYQARYGMENSHDDDRFGESFEARRSPMTIKEGLELCGITGDNYFVVSETGGKCMVFSSVSSGHQPDYKRFFDEQAYVEDIERRRQVDKQASDELEPVFSSMRLSPYSGDANRMRVHQHNDTSQSPDYAANDGNRRSRKRHRSASLYNGGIKTEDSIPKIPVQSKRGIEIGDEEGVYAFYDQRLRFCQQTACKTIAKAWIKTVEPRKQSAHPYTRGIESRPDWWPRTFVKFGTDVVYEMRHREPDHLSRDERVTLLCHILRLVVEPPATQHEAIRKANLDLKKMEAITFEALSVWFSDRQAPNNVNKKPILREIFRVARQEQRYKSGEIDPKTEVFVQAIADHKLARGSIDEDSEDENPIFTPGSSVGSPAMIIPQPQTADQGQASQFPGSSIAETMPMQTAQYPNPGFDSELPADRVTYMEAPGMANHTPAYGHSHLVLPEIYPSSQGPSRRPSVFSSTPDFGSPAPSSIYPSWQNPTSPNSPHMYSFPAQPAGAQHFGSHMAQSHPHTASTMEGLPTQANANQHGNVFGLRPIGQPALHPQQGYTSYVPDAASMPSIGIKTEDNHHHPLQ